MANQWYIQEPVRYRHEVNAVYEKLGRLNPKEVVLPDGRHGFIMDFKVPDPEGILLGADGAHYQNYRVLMAWNNDHPHSASSSFGGSVRTYFQSPTAEDIVKAYRAHGRQYVPHLMGDRHPVTGASIWIPCTQKLGQENDGFTMVTAAALVMNWLSAMTAGKYRDSAYRAFCEE